MAEKTEKKLNVKQMKKIHTWLRAAIQLLYFIFIPSVYTAAFAGVKYIFTQIGAGEKVALTSFVSVLIVVCVYTMIFGRFFCGFACAFGSFGDAVNAIYRAVCKKLKKKPVQIPEHVASKLAYLKYVLLIIIVLMCYNGVYSKAQGTSPWDVFSMIHAGNFRLGGYGIGLVILILLIVGMCLEERFFCRNLCPMGAVFSLVPVLPLFSLHRDRGNCIPKCSGCTRKCPSDIGLPEDGSWKVEGDCFQCQKCIDTCPKKNIHCGVKALRGNEIWFTVLRTVILLGLFIWLGV